MNYLKSSVTSVLLMSFTLVNATGIYKNGWIDFNKNGVKDIYEDPTQPIANRIKNLLSQMTVEEKTCQMATLYGSGRVLKDAAPTPEWTTQLWKDGIANIDEQANGHGRFGTKISFPYSISVNNRYVIQKWFVEKTRLGIPVDFTNEGIRGLCHDRATMFPAQSAQGSTWDRQLIRQIGDIEGKEAKALGYTNIYSPILDISQDPRWGRAVECYGEDPYLVGELGKQMVLGLQESGVASTVKHFAVYSVPVGGRDGGTRTDPHVAPREVRTLYLEPFRKAFVEAGALGTMSSYNDYNGDPITGSYHFLTEILRNEYGFKGYVVSDSKAVEFLRSKHNVDSTKVDMVADAVNAGLNVRTNFTPPEDFVTPLREAVATGKVSMETLNKRVGEVLYVKFKLGLFDNPYTGDSVTAEKIVHSKEHQEVAKKAALEAVVLLKNEHNMLPLSKDLKNVAVIGPNADEIKLLTDRYGPDNIAIHTIYSSIKAYLPKANVQYAKGCDIIDKYFPESELYDVPLDKNEQAMIDEAVNIAKKSEVAIMVLGGNESTIREGHSRTDLDLSGRQQQLLQAVYSTGTPVVLVMVDGRAATINWADKYVPAILHAWFGGEFMGDAVAETLFGDNNPGGHLTVTFPKSVGEIPFAFPFKPGSDSKGIVRVAGELYPFGYGLSYTTFDYTDLQISKPAIKSNENLTVSCVVTNTGKVSGDAVPQLYINDNYSSVITYEKVLRGFERVHLNPGESKTVKFTLTPNDLAIWDINNKFTVEPGAFTIMIGPSSQDIKLRRKFKVM